MSKRSHEVSAAPAPAAAPADAPAAAVAYALDPGHTEVFASWRHFGFSTPGAMFCGIRGSLTWDSGHPERAAVEVTIPLAGLHTTVPLQDRHLLSAEFFDAAKYPEIRFRSTRVRRGSAAGRFEVTGALTVHGVTRTVTLDATLNGVGPHPLHDNAPAIGFDAAAHVKRSDFGMDAHVPAVSDRIDLRITAEAVESRAWQSAQAARAH